jgi:hypothetical protein
MESEGLCVGVENADFGPGGFSTDGVRVSRAGGALGGSVSTVSFPRSLLGTSDMLLGYYSTRSLVNNIDHRHTRRNKAMVVGGVVNGAKDFRSPEHASVASSVVR